MSPADELRAAAERLGKLAADATPGLWETGGIGDYGWTVRAVGRRLSLGIETEDSDQGKADAEYIAAMGPQVGEQVANWLSLRSADLRRREGLHAEMAEPVRLWPSDEAALAVARAVLGDRERPQRTGRTQPATRFSASSRRREAMPDIRPAISIGEDGSAEWDEIDYDKEPGPFWLVEVDGSPVLPERPLPLEKAIGKFRQEVSEAARFGDRVHLRQCTEEDLEWAGISDGDGNDRV